MCVALLLCGPVQAGVSFWSYSLLSLLAAGAVVYHAISTRREFYPVVIYLVTSKVSISVRCGVCVVGRGAGVV
jgi:hypothetical protein